MPFFDSEGTFAPVGSQLLFTFDPSQFSNVRGESKMVTKNICKNDKKAIENLFSEFSNILAPDF